VPGIESLYRFAVHQTREAAARATGSEPPAWDASKPGKYWADPNPPDADEEGNVRYTVLALAPDKKTPAVSPATGRPYLRTLTISRQEAMAVNIPPKDFARDTHTVDPGALSPMALIEVPVPCRSLRDDEELFFGFGGGVQVRAKGTVPAPTQPGSSSVEQRLSAIESNQQTILAQLAILIAAAKSQ